MKRQLAAHFVQQLLSTLTAAWLLGREPMNVPWATSTLLGRWRCSIAAAYSKKYLTKLEDKQSIALQHTLDLALFDWVKVRLLDFGPEETIRDLCVSSYAAFVAHGVLTQFSEVAKCLPFFNAPAGFLDTRTGH